MIILTGGAGFIGSCILSRLNKEGREDIIVVDHMGDDPLKRANLNGKRFIEYVDKGDFLQRLLSGAMPSGIDTLIHMGACSSTTLTDADYYEQNNFQYTKHLAEWSLRENVRFIYASSAATYGDGSKGYADEEDRLSELEPLNLYGESKHKFDCWAKTNGHLDTFVGLKFFNVFGPNEYHKGDMRSVIAKAYPQARDEGKMFLFKSYRPDYADGEQKRDFIYVKDAVDVVFFFWHHPQTSGIFNVGTGQARSWNDLARALFHAVGQSEDITYIDMPEHLRPRYQYFTEAEIAKLRAAGYDKEFFSLEDAVKDYLPYLAEERHT